MKMRCWKICKLYICDLNNQENINVLDKVLNNKILMSLLSEKLKNFIVKRELNIEDFELTKSRNGKPILRDFDHLCVDFNISHTENLLIGMLIKEGKIGVDTEIKKLMYPEIAELFMSRMEFEYFKKINDDDKIEFFYKLWTLKEAFIKMTGEGLQKDLKLINFNISKLIRNVYEIEGYDAYFKSFDYRNDYIISICSNIPIKKIDHEFILVKDLLY